MSDIDNAYDLSSVIYTAKSSAFISMPYYRPVLFIVTSIFHFPAQILNHTKVFSLSII